MVSGVIATIFAGAGERAPRAWQRKAFELGRSLARAGWIVRTGAGRSPSLMGCVVDGARAEGGRVEGVILDRFLRLLHPAMRDASVVKTMARRKEGLMRRARAVIVLPGGYGTFDELFNVLVLRQIGVYHGPIVVVDFDHYFTPLRAVIAQMRRHDFIHDGHRAQIAWVRSVRGAMRAISFSA